MYLVSSVSSTARNKIHFSYSRGLGEGINKFCLRDNEAAINKSLGLSNCGISLPKKLIRYRLLKRLVLSALIYYSINTCYNFTTIQADLLLMYFLKVWVWLTSSETWDKILMRYACSCYFCLFLHYLSVYFLFF